MPRRRRRNLVHADISLSPPRRERGPLRSVLAVRNFQLYFIGQTVSVSGTWMQTVAIALLVLQISESGAWLGLVIACRYAPVLLLSLWGGVIADRLPKRRIIIAASTANGMLATTLGICVLLSSVSIPLVMAICALMGAANAFDNPARQAWLSELVTDALLHSAVRLNSTLISIARIIGPLLAAVVITRWDLGWCFVLNAMSFGAVVVVTAVMQTSASDHSTSVDRQPGQIRQALRHVYRTRLLVIPMSLVAVNGALTLEFPVTLPLMAEYVFEGDAAVYACMTASMGAGAVLSGIVGASRPPPSNRSLWLSAVAWGIAICAAALSPSLPVMYFLLFFVGYGSVSFNSNTKTVLQLQASPDMRGRVMALWALAWIGSGAFGAPLVGAIGELLGARYALLLGGLAAVVGGIAVIQPLRERTPLRRSM
nr:MFS transporter [Rhodococcus kyotonensis]